LIARRTAHHCAPLQVWHAGSREDRQTIARLLLERVLVEVIDGSERVDVECHWHGGNPLLWQFRSEV
jgi:sulfatase maturation enzyme AslB (radical SAM superfamily)